MELQLIRNAELKRPRPLAHLQLPARVENALLRGGIRTIGQLITRSREDLVTEIRGLGAIAALTIVDALAGEGLTLARDAGETRYPGKTRQHVLNHYAWLDPLPVENPGNARNGDGLRCPPLHPASIEAGMAGAQIAENAPAESTEPQGLRRLDR